MDEFNRILKHHSAVDLDLFAVCRDYDHSCSLLDITYFTVSVDAQLVTARDSS